MRLKVCNSVAETMFRITSNNYNKYAISQLSIEPLFHCFSSTGLPVNNSHLATGTSTGSGESVIIWRASAVVKKKVYWCVVAVVELLAKN